MRNRIGFATILLGLLVGAGSTAFAIEVTLFTVDDTAVLGQSKDLNRGAEASVRIRYDADDTGTSYVMAKYDLSSIPTNAVINNVRMRFFTELWSWPVPPEGASFSPVAIFNNLGDWSETNVTWNTAPAFDGVAVETLDHFGLIGVNEDYFTGTNTVVDGDGGDRWLEYVGSGTRILVQGWVDGSIPNHGVSVKGTGDYLGWGTGDRLFFLKTKEHPDAPVHPTLIIDYDLLPATNTTDNLILGASDDSWVDGNQPSWGINHGADDVMRVRYDNQPSDWGQNLSLVKFDLSALSGQLIDLKSAKIRFNTSLISWPGLTNFSPMAIFNNTGGWDESTVTWNNVPAHDVTAVETLDYFSSAFGGEDVYFTGTNGITSGGWLEYESSNTMAMVDGWINGTIPNHGVTIMGVTNLDAYRVFALTTKENSTDGARPQLILEYDVVGFYGYDSWADSYGGTGVIGSIENDYEPDGLNNLMEYAFGGNPTNADAAAVNPTIAGGADIVHVYRRRVPSELSYELYVDTDFNLITYGWTNAAVYGAIESSEPAADPGFREVTTTFTGAGAVLDQVFLKLEVTK